MLNNNSTIEDLGAALAALNTPVRIRPQRSRAGTRFLTTVNCPNGAAMFSSSTLAGVLANTIAFLQLQSAAGEIEALAPDPEGAHVGPAPRPDPTGTSVGYPPPMPQAHCAVCGYGENDGEAYSLLTGEPCSNCGAVGQPCPMGPGHEGNHALQEDSGENRIDS